MSASTFPRTGALTATAFERLLQTLDPDRERAAAAYERLRESISGLMFWWGARTPSELADETIDRVARKLEEGAKIREGSLGAYVRGVARLVFYEASRRPGHEVPLSDSRELAAPEPGDNAEPALVCLDGCLSSITLDERKLVLRYYDLEKSGKADARRRLASEVGISTSALRIRTFRLRERLERCVSACLERQ
jgi:DNA-directed RNA polymerase specialized sigma24 family protein